MSEFTKWANAARDAGPGAHHIIGASRIEADGLQFEQQEITNSNLKEIGNDLKTLDQTISGLVTSLTGLNKSIEKFNKDTGDLYKTLNWWTAVIAITTIINLLVAILKK